MNLIDVLATRNQYTEATSGAARQLSFAGIAAIWLLRTGESSPTVPDALIPSLGFFALSLALDLLHYVAASLFWTGYFFWLEHKKVRRNKQFLVPKWLNAPAYFFFLLKVVAVLVGYILLISYLARAWGLHLS